MGFCMLNEILIFIKIVWIFVRVLNISFLSLLTSERSWLLTIIILLSVLFSLVNSITTKLIILIIYVIQPVIVDNIDLLIGFFFISLVS